MTRRSALVRRRPDLRLGGALALALGAAATRPAAQDQATTLARLCGRADTVAVLRVLQVRETAGRRKVLFAVAEVLRGEKPRSPFPLTEPAGRACGHALRGLLPGRSVVAFLRLPGPRLAAPSARSLAPFAPRLLAHVRGLLAARDAAARRRLLLGGLSSPDQRVRRDAELELVLAPGLEHLDPAGRARLVSALRARLSEGADTVPALALAAARARAIEALDVLLPFYLEGRRPALDRALLETFSRFDPEAVVRRTVAAAAADGPRAARALDVMLALSPHPAVAVGLRAMLRSPDRAVAAGAAAALLARGAHRAELARRVPASVLRAAEARRRARPRFRSILR